MQTRPHAPSIARLNLTSFRNYLTLRLETSPSPVVLVGPNGSGKTNILEAISLLAPGRGLRRAALGDLPLRHNLQPWAVVAEIIHPTGFTTLATGSDPEASGLPRRLVKIDGKPAKGQTALLQHLSLGWLTPEMDRIFTEGQSARRKLLDRLVYGFDPGHAARVNRYEESMRERLRLLRDGPQDAAWLNALEDAMATSGTAIAAARMQMAAQLNAQMEQVTGPFPAASISLSGLVEETLQNNPAVVTEDILRTRFAAARRHDEQSGTTSLGPQRSDLQVLHRPQSMPAELCSTGEQKALLITITLCHALLLRQWRGTAPLLLLDDIASHLDPVRRDALYQWLLDIGGQFWISGTEMPLFETLRGKTQFYHIYQGAKPLSA